MSKPRKSQTPVVAIAVETAPPSNGKPAPSQKLADMLDLAAIEKAKERIEAAKRKVFDAERVLEEEQSKLSDLLGPIKELNKLAGGR